MARLFIDDTATGAADGTTWADAYTSIPTAITAGSANDMFIIANTHSEDGSAIGNLTFPSKCKVLTSTVSGVDTVTPAIATSAQYYTNTAIDDVSYNFTNGTAYGIWFAARRTINVRFCSSTKCIWENTYNTSRKGQWNRGTTNSTELSIDDTYLCTTTPANGIVTGDSAKVKIVRIYLDVNGWEAADKIFDTNGRGTLIVEGGDVSAAAATTLLNLNDTGTTTIRDLVINASVTSLTTAAPNTVGAEVSIDTCDSGNNSQRRYLTATNGEAISDAGIVLDNETPAAQSNSLKLVTNTEAVEWIAPLRILLISVWVDLSTAKTFTVELAQDGTTTPLKDTELNLEIDYPDDLTTGRLTDNSQGTFDSGSNITSSTAAWTGLSGTNVKQKVSATTTQTSKAGLVDIYLNLSKPSSSVYFDGKVVIS